MNGPCRSTNVASVFLNTVGSSSVAQFGDAGKADLRSRAIAVQRAVPNYEQDETRFASYEIFARPRLQLDTGLAVAFRKTDCSPEIRIGCVNAIGISSASIFRAGCGGPHEAQTRIKHIRHFNTPGIR